MTKTTHQLSIEIIQSRIKTWGVFSPSLESKSKKYVSFSRIVNDELRKTIKQNLTINFVNT